MKHLILVFSILVYTSIAIGQTGLLKGKIKGSEGPVSYATIGISELNMGAYTDENGLFELENIPFGSYEISISALGFTKRALTISLSEKEPTQNLNITLTPVAAQLDQVVVSGTRTSRARRDLPVSVQVLSSETFEATQAACLADALNFQSGLRMETDCQTCNYTQLRMNGLGGGYSQILINSRPVFSALNGLYGLEQIPANMIDRVEIVRGGGSALFGSSAIAGTVNIITKSPMENSFSAGVTQSLIDGTASDNLLNANLTQVNDNQTAGITFFASRRQREEWDANDDGFSELPRIMNNSFGLTAFFNPTKKWNINLNVNSINEQRDGGDLLDEAPHKRTQSEQRITHILSGVADAVYHISDRQNIQLYGGMQRTDRTHYTGVDGDDGYGNTDNYTIQSGIQYNLTFDDFLGSRNTFTAGTEYQLDDIFDAIPAYNYLIDQRTIQSGTFLQSDWEVFDKVNLLTGIRMNYHNLAENLVWTPRVSLMYSILPMMKARFSYGRGFRAPQAFDADLHIAFAGGGVSTIQLDPNLRSEFSDSYTVSWDFDKATDRSIFGITIAGFYTQLDNVFVLEERGEDADGNMILEKRNGNESTVAGVTIEGRANFNNWIELDAGMTFQRSEFSNPVAWSNEIDPVDQYLRTPDEYGFFTLTFLPEKPFHGTLSGVYTGSMLVPHFGGAPGVPNDRLVRSQNFMEVNLKLTYDIPLPKLAQTLQLSAGIQNIFQAYQNDFDIGKNRDSNYVYGPARPRTFFVGLKWSS